MDSNQPNIEQFLSNSSFVKWVKEPDDVSNEFWNNWLLNNPDKKEMFDLAKSIIQNLAYKHQYHLDKQELDAMFESIKSTVAQNSEAEKQQAISIFTNSLKRFWWVAASVVIGITYSLQTEFAKEHLMTSVLTMGNKQFYGANPGERIKVILPDGSIVTLQGGSSISYNADFQDSIRKVDLNGQAFFEVVKNLYLGLKLDRALIRLVGVSLDGLVEDEQIKQLALGERASGWQQADQAVDRIKSRFGRGSLRPARLVQDHEEE